MAVAVFRFVDSNELSGVKDASHIYSVKHSMRELNSQLNQNRTKPGVIAWLAASVALLCLPVTLAFGDCPADLDGSGEVGGSDIGLLLAQWGPGSGSADLNEDGLVSGADLGAMLGAWGWCPCEESLEFDPIHDGLEPLEPAIVEHTRDAMITRIADRARDRHAREDIVNGVPFRTYDHWLPFYWEQRVAEIEIIDRAAKGGDGLTVNFVTLDRLNPAEFRTFYASGFAGYHNNMSDFLNAGVTLVSSGPSERYPGESEYRYTAEIQNKWPEQTPLAIGDRMEIELSQFLAAPRNGRLNYYGTAMLYVVGEGIVPWYAKAKEEASTPEEQAAASFDSFPLPEHAWLGGQTTLPYQYSNEPDDRFKQMAGNISHASGHAFTVGRRLHHTDFDSGVHSEDGNPLFAEHIGKVGPRFVNTSCVACHIGNGRALPPAVGEAYNQAVIQVGRDADGNPHPILGEVLQPSTGSTPGGGGGGGDGDAFIRIEAEDFSVMSGVETEPCTDEGGGLNVGFIDSGDWMAYVDHPVDIPSTGTYLIAFRVASAIGGGTLRFEEVGGSPLHGTIDIPATGGWQSWTTVTLSVQLSEGEHRFGINAAAGGWNFNWFEILEPDGFQGGEPEDVEGSMILAAWEDVPGAFGDGSSYTLRRPVYEFTGPVPEYYSVRLAPQLVGVGLLEAIDEMTLLELADECDLDQDGISGRLRTVENPADPDRSRIGRFGARGSTASVREQIAYAMNRDMGVSSEVFPVLDGDVKPSPIEIGNEDLDLMDRYTSLLGIAARRNLLDPAALEGEVLFAAANCTACHVPTVVTGSTHPYAELRDQTIHPYTDMLLHDMGPGLADNLGDHGVSGAEWRTPALWNIGLTEGVSGGEAYLHDGRARTHEEAILWHGGEAEASKEAFRNMSAEDRAAIVAFLKSL